MKLHAEVDAHGAQLGRITAGARRSYCPAYGDILWGPLPDLGERLQALMDDPGVMFESPRRVVLFQRIGDDLRYYALTFYSRHSQSSARLAKTLRPYRDRAWILRRWIEARLTLLLRRLTVRTSVR